MLTKFKILFLPEPDRVLLKRFDSRAEASFWLEARLKNHPIYRNKRHLYEIVEIDSDGNAI
jgi:hypothetical protein